MTREVKPRLKNWNAIHGQNIGALISYCVRAIRVDVQVEMLFRHLCSARRRTLLARVQNELEENADGCPENETAGRAIALTPGGSG